MIRVIVTGLIAGTLVLPAFALDLDEYQVVDLSHAYSSETLYWPTSPCHGSAIVVCSQGR